MIRGCFAILIVAATASFLTGCDQTPTLGPAVERPTGPPIYGNGDPDEIIEGGDPEMLGSEMVLATYSEQKNSLELLLFYGVPLAIAGPDADQLTPELAAWAYEYGQGCGPTTSTVVRIRTCSGRVIETTWGEIKAKFSGGG